LVWKKCQNNWLNQYQQIVFCFNTKWLTSEKEITSYQLWWWNTIGYYNYCYRNQYKIDFEIETLLKQPISLF
jgi:hypothetical protein